MDWFCGIIISVQSLRLSHFKLSFLPLQVFLQNVGGTLHRNRIIVFHECPDLGFFLFTSWLFPWRILHQIEGLLAALRRMHREGPFIAFVLTVVSQHERVWEVS